MLDLSKLKDQLIAGGAFFALFVAVFGVFWSMKKQSEPSKTMTVTVHKKTPKVQDFVVDVQNNEEQVLENIPGVRGDESDIFHEADQVEEDEVEYTEIKDE